MTDQPVEGRVTPPAMMPPAVGRGRREDGDVPDRTPAKDRSKRPNVCERCGETIGVVEDHLPNCQRSTAIVGTMLLGNAVLEATGTTPIKLMLHADGTVTWRPLYGGTWQEPATGPGRTEGGGRS
jgi:hypothetical protein